MGSRLENNIYKELLLALQAGKRNLLITIFKHPEENDRSEKILLSEECINNSNGSKNFYPEDLYREADTALKTGCVYYGPLAGHEKVLIEPFYPEPRLVILGGGHIAVPLAELGAGLGYRITVVDDRPSFADRNRFPAAAEVICEDFEKSFDLMCLNKFTFLVIATRGHRHDLSCLRTALNYDLAYLGMIGSRRKVQYAREQLIAEGHREEKLDRVCAPIGLYIGAVTPGEISVSIMAQIISARRMGRFYSGPVSIWPEFERNVIVEMAGDGGKNGALVSVVHSRGSTPRKAGAKMFVQRDGKILGSIGGGLIEAMASREAMEVMEYGGYRYKQFDISGEMAENDGMICGGCVGLVIEAYSCARPYTESIQLITK